MFILSGSPSLCPIRSLFPLIYSAVKSQINSSLFFPNHFVQIRLDTWKFVKNLRDDSTDRNRQKHAKICIFQLARYSIFRRRFYIHRIKKRYEKRYVLYLTSNQVPTPLHYFIAITYFITFYLIGIIEHAFTLSQSNNKESRIRKNDARSLQFFRFTDKWRKRTRITHWIRNNRSSITYERNDIPPSSLCHYTWTALIDPTIFFLRYLQFLESGRSGFQPDWTHVHTHTQTQKWLGNRSRWYINIYIH